MSRLEERIAEIDRQARTFASDDGRRIEALGALNDARSALSMAERAVGRASWVLSAEIDHDQEADTGGWEVR